MCALTPQAPGMPNMLHKIISVRQSFLNQLINVFSKFHPQEKSGCRVLVLVGFERGVSIQFNSIISLEDLSLEHPMIVKFN